MKYCAHCGKPMEDNARFCFACGKEVGAAPTPTQTFYQQPGNPAEEKECLDNFYTTFKWERIAWKVSGIVGLVLAIVYGSTGGFIMFLNLISDGELNMMIAGFGIPYVFFALVILPIVIINLKMISRAQYYMDTLYADTAGMVKRTSSIGMIVFAAIFNQYALICIIINFVRTKSNKALLDRIIARQQAR